tara:strand:- start:1356 stop:1574 length:219 start_codon:yes stop_codon:yes gene_type:complete
MMFRVGDLVRYRDRIPTDPEPRGDERDGWGEMGIVIKIVYWNNDSEHLDALEVVTPIGDNMIVKMVDVAILS